MTEGLRPFSFEAPGAMLMEWGAARRLGELLSGWTAARRLLIVTDRFLHEAGVLDRALASLRGSGFVLTLFDDVVADPPEEVLAACVQEGRAGGCDIVMGLGGGSSMDIAKLAAVMLCSSQPLSALYGIGNVEGARLPLIQVPTTAGTGSEATNITILTTSTPEGEPTKMGIVAPRLFADRVLLDSELTLRLPPQQTAATGIDAMVHAIEAYTGRHRKNPMSDALAREALRLLSSALIRACQQPGDRAAREAMLLGANLAGQAFANSPVAAVHALAYPLGGHYHLPHGLTNALMLGPVLRFNMAAAAPLYAELAEVVSAPGAGNSTEARSSAFVALMEDLMTRSGAPRRLRDCDVPQADLAALARDAMLQTRLLVNNPVEVTEADALRLYEEAW